MTRPKTSGPFAPNASPQRTNDLLAEIRELLAALAQRDHPRTAKNWRVVDGNEGDAVRHPKPMLSPTVSDDFVQIFARVADALSKGSDILVLTDPDLVSAVQKLLAHGGTIADTSARRPENNSFEEFVARIGKVISNETSTRRSKGSRQ